MVSLASGLLVVESSILYSMDRDKVIDLLDTLSGYCVYRSEETCYTLVETSSGRRIYLAIGVNSLFIDGDEELKDLLRRDGIRYYINLKNVWVKACKIHSEESLGTLLREVLDRLEDTGENECIYMDRGCNISYSMDNYVLKVCRAYSDTDVRVVAVKPYHPIAYGVLDHTELFTRESIDVLGRYLSESTGYDTLAYILVDNEYKSLLDINEPSRLVRINATPRSIDLFRLLMNSMLYVLCT